MNKMPFNLLLKFQNYRRKPVNSSFDWKFHTEKQCWKLNLKTTCAKFDFFHLNAEFCFECYICLRIFNICYNSVVRIMLKTGFQYHRNCRSRCIFREYIISPKSAYITSFWKSARQKYWPWYFGISFPYRKISCQFAIK